MTTLFLDTQVMIWMEEGPTRIPPFTRLQTSQADSLLVSVVSVWELAVKIKTGKLNLKLPLEEFVESFQATYRIELLPVKLTHIYHTQQLPLHHRDPFDRLLIAQSFVEKIPVVSSDAAWDAYGVRRVWNNSQ